MQLKIKEEEEDLIRRTIIHVSLAVAGRSLHAPVSMMVASTVQIIYMCDKNPSSLKTLLVHAFTSKKVLRTAVSVGRDRGANCSVSGQHLKSFARRGMMIMMVSNFLPQNQLVTIFTCC